MKFEIPRIYKDLALAEYAPEFEEQTIRVWVNPPEAYMNELFARKFENQAAETEGLVKGLSALWEDWTEEDAMNMVEESASTDPGFPLWLCSRTVQMVAEHRALVKKA